MQFFPQSKVFFIINFLSETLAYLKLPLSVSLPDHLNFLQCLSGFRVAFKTSISNQGLVLDFTLKVLIGETESTADKNLVTKVLLRMVHTGMSSQEILLILIYPQKIHLSNFSFT